MGQHPCSGQSPPFSPQPPTSNHHLRHKHQNPGPRFRHRREFELPTRWVFRGSTRPTIKFRDRIVGGHPVGYRIFRLTGNFEIQVASPALIDRKQVAQIKFPIAVAG